MGNKIFPLTEHHCETITLKPLTPANASFLGEAMAEMSPWSVLGWSAERMIASLQALPPCVCCFEIHADDQIAGLIQLQSPWLFGPYLQRLAVLPSFQGRGVGQQALGWMEQRARATGARHLWLCVSSFNDGAQAFYKKAGFVPVAMLDGLVIENADEILMRKRLDCRQYNAI